jgi:hypothetical protein
MLCNPCLLFSCHSTFSSKVSIRIITSSYTTIRHSQMRAPIIFLTWSIGPTCFLFIPKWVSSYLALFYDTGRLGPNVWTPEQKFEFSVCFLAIYKLMRGRVDKVRRQTQCNSPEFYLKAIRFESRCNTCASRWDFRSFANFFQISTALAPLIKSNETI